MCAWSVIRPRTARTRPAVGREARLHSTEPASEERALTSRRTLLAILALPAAAIGYALTAAILSGLPIPDGLQAIVLTIVPLFVAGLCMVPFVLPLFDQMAKRDLAAYRASQPAEPDGSEAPKPD